MSGEKRTSFTVFLLGMLAFWANGDNYAAAALLPKIATDLGTDIRGAALTVTSYMLFFGLLTVLFGPLGDRYGRQRILKAAAFGSALFSMLSAFVWSLGSLVAVRAVNGAFSAGIMPLAVAYAGESANAENRQLRIGVVMGMMFLGGALATVIGGAVAYLGSWKAVYFIYGAAELVVAVLLLIFMENIPAPAARTGILSSYRTVLTNPGMLRIMGLLLLIGFSTMGAFSFLGKLIQDRTGFNLMIVGALLSAYGTGTFIGGRTAQRLRASVGSPLFAGLGAAGGAAIVILGLVSAQPLLFLPALFIYGFGFVTMQSSAITTAQELSPVHRGTVMSAASFTMVVSGALGTSINGMIIATAGFTPFVIAVGAGFAAAGAVAAVVLRAGQGGGPGRRAHGGPARLQRAQR